MDLSDFVKIVEILDRRNIAYNLVHGGRNYHGDEPDTAILIEGGYVGFYSELGFDSSGRLLYVKAFEG